MSFRILGLSPEPFRPLFALPDKELHERGARRVFADGTRYPCRVSIAHAAAGEEMLLLSFEHQPANTPYRATHAIFVRKVASERFNAVDSIPEVLATRMLSVRAFDSAHMMIDADVCDGAEADLMFERLLANPQTGYLHVHNARQGCYAARVQRA